MMRIVRCVFERVASGFSPGRGSQAPARRMTTFLAFSRAPGGAWRSAVLVAMPRKPVLTSVPISPHPAHAARTQMAVRIDHLDAARLGSRGEKSDHARKLRLRFLF